MNDGGEWLGIAGIAILLAWYALAAVWLAWRRHVPEPPKPEANLSPAEARFLLKGQFDGRTLLVAILDLVARRALSLKQRPNGTSYLERSLDRVGDDDLPDADALVRASLFRAGNTMVDLTDAREDALLHSGIALRSWLERRYLSDPRLSRSAWMWLLLAGGALAAAAIIVMAGREGGYGMGLAALTIIFYLFGLVSIGTAILFVEQFRQVILVLKLVIIFTLIPAWPVLLVLLAGNLIDFHETHGIVGSSFFALPLIGSGVLLWVGRPRFEVPAAAMRQMDNWHRRLQAPANADARAPLGASSSADSASAAIDPLSIVAVAFDAGDAGRLGTVFDDLRFPSDRISLFGARKGPAVDLGSLGHIATRFRIWVGFLLCLLVVTFASHSHAATIHRIDLSFTIQPDGTVDVVEEWHLTIDEENKFGLFRRVLPIWETDVSEIEIESVLRNGESEPWTLSTVGSPFSLIVGTRYRNSLRENEQIYVFNYRLSDFVVRTDEEDYLLWVVSRTLLDFGIAKDIEVRASVVAPVDMRIQRARARLSDNVEPASGDVYVEGTIATSDNHATAEIQIGHDAADFEHIVLMVAFPPNSFVSESWFSRLERTLFHSHHIAGPLLIAAVLAYFGFAWHKTRRRMRPTDDKAGTPLSPAFMRFLSLGRYDHVAIAATVRSLIAKRLLRVDTFDDGSMQIRRGLEHEARAAATGDEQAFLDRLFPGSSTTVPLNDTATDRFSDAGLALRSHIQSKFYRLTIRENRTWVLLGLALTGGGIFLMTQYGPSVEYALDFALPLWFLLVAVGAVGEVLYNQIMAIASGTRPGLLLRALGMLLVFLVVLASFYYCLHTTAELVGQVVTLACILSLILSALLFWAQNRSVRPSPDARRQIREMRSRLAQATREPGGVVGTPTVVEDLIPYAVALDRSGKWSRVLEERLRALGKMGPAVDIKPWYDGGSINLVDYGRVAHYLPRR